MMLVASIFSFNIFGNQHHAIYALSSWLNKHKFFVILWHIFIIAAIYYGWNAKINLAAKRSQLDVDKTIKLKRFKWVLILMVIVIDFFIFK